MPNSWLTEDCFNGFRLKAGNGGDMPLVKADPWKARFFARHPRVKELAVVTISFDPFMRAADVAIVLLPGDVLSDDLTVRVLPSPMARWVTCRAIERGLLKMTFPFPGLGSGRQNPGTLVVTVGRWCPVQFTVSTTRL